MRACPCILKNNNKQPKFICIRAQNRQIELLIDAQAKPTKM